MRARVSACTRWNAGPQESRRGSTDYLSLDQFRQDDETQTELYAKHVQPFVERCLEGYCGSIITYGAWGSGKSYTLGTLDPQHLTLTGLSDDNAGVLPRCISQLYGFLGSRAAVEITCSEVQGEDVVDLLDPRVCLPVGRLPPTGLLVTSSPTLSPSAQLTASSSSSPGQGFGAQGAATRHPIAAAAARRKPLTLVVVRSLAEALVCLKRAISNRQAFVTATRHSSSRTHAVIQLRWRNADSPLRATPGGHPLASAPRSARTATSLRPYSAPPRGELQAFASSGVVSRVPLTDRGSVCALTLVDTCSFCPLLPPKEGSAVKRSLLALTRVLIALQRPQALSLRESKLTRMLEGAVDQVLVLACLAGNGDEATVQLVKMLQQGGTRDGGVRRSRRASLSDSPRMSSAWEAASRSSLCSSSARSLGKVPVSTSLRKSPQQPAEGVVDQHRKLSARQRPQAPTTAGWDRPGASGQGQLLHGRTRRSIPTSTFSLFYSPAASPAPIDRREVAAAAGRGVSTGGVPEAEGVSGVREGAPMGHGRARPGFNDAKSFPVDCCDEDDGDGDVDSEGEDVHRTGARAGGSVLIGGGAILPVASVPLPPLAGGAAAPDSQLPTTPLHGGARVARDLTADLYNTYDVVSPADVSRTAPDRAAPSRQAGVRSTPVVDLVSFDPCRGVTRGRRTASAVSGEGTGGASAVAKSSKLSPRIVSPREKAAKVTARASPGQEVHKSQGFSVLAGKWAPPPKPSSHRTDTFPVVPCVLSPRDNIPLRPAPAARSSSSLAHPSTSAAAGGAASARKRSSGIPGRPPTCSPAAPAPATSTFRLASRASPRSPSPAPRAAGTGTAAPLVSLTTVRPTPLASMRYGSANQSHDSAPDGSGAAALGAAIAGGPVLAVSPKLSAQHQPSSGSRAQAPLEPPAVVALAVRRSISSGTRWPSPLLRARRAEWLAEERRSRSAMPRPCGEAADDGSTPRRRGRAWRCAPLGRPTLSSQYKDLLMDFEAFKAKERNPRRRTNVHSGGQQEQQQLATPAAPTPVSETQSCASRPAAQRQLYRRPHATAVQSPSPAADRSTSLTSLQLAPPTSSFVATTVSLASLAINPPVSGSSTTAPASGSAQPSVPGAKAAFTNVSSQPPAPPQSATPTAVAFPASKAATPVATKPPFNRQHSPSADEGLMSLTAAAAVAAASPRTPPCGGMGAAGSRSRPGVLRGTSTHASPRHRCSPDTIIPTVVLDMSRLSVAAAPAATTAPGSARTCRLGEGGNAQAKAGTHEGDGRQGGGRREFEPGRESDDSGADPTCSDNERGNILGPRSLMDLNRMLHEDAALRQSAAMSGADGSAAGTPRRTPGLTPRQRPTPRGTPRERAEAAGCEGAAADIVAAAAPPAAALAVVMEKEEAEVPALADIVSGPTDCQSAKLEAGVRQAGDAGQKALHQPPTSAAMGTAAVGGAPGGPLPECGTSTDFELPAVSFFIHHFTPNPKEACGPEWGSGAGSQESVGAHEHAGSGNPCLGLVAASHGASKDRLRSTEAIVASLEPDTAGAPTPLSARTRGGDADLGPGCGRSNLAPGAALVVTAAPDDRAVDPEQERAGRRLDLVALNSIPGAAIASETPSGNPAGTPQAPAQKAVAGPRTCGTPLQQRESDDVLIAVPSSAVSVTEADAALSAGAAAAVDSSSGLALVSAYVPDQDRMSVESAGVLRGSCTPFATGACLSHLNLEPEPPAQPAPGLQQSPRQQQQQQPSAPSCASVVLSPRSPQLLQPPPTPRSLAATLLVQLAHVRPNHSELDEHSTVLVGVESGAESELDPEDVTLLTPGRGPTCSQGGCSSVPGSSLASARSTPGRETELCGARVATAAATTSAAVGGAQGADTRGTASVHPVGGSPAAGVGMPSLSPRSPRLVQPQRCPRQQPAAQPHSLQPPAPASGAEGSRSTDHDDSHKDGPVPNEPPCAASQSSVRNRVAALEAVARSPRASVSTSIDLQFPGPGPARVSRLRQSWPVNDSVDATGATHSQGPASPAGSCSSGGRRSGIPSRMQSVPGGVAAAVAAIESPRTHEAAESCRSTPRASGGGGLSKIPGRGPRVNTPGWSPLGTAAAPGHPDPKPGSAGPEAPGQALCPILGAPTVTEAAAQADRQHSQTPRKSAREPTAEEVGVPSMQRSAGPGAQVAVRITRTSPVGLSTTSLLSSGEVSLPSQTSSIVIPAHPASAAAGLGNAAGSLPSSVQDAAATSAPSQPAAAAQQPGNSSTRANSPGRSPQRLPPPASRPGFFSPGHGKAGAAPGPSPLGTPGRSSTLTSVLSPERLPGLRNRSLNATTPGRTVASSSGRAFGLSPGRILGPTSSRSQQHRSPGRVGEGREAGPSTVGDSTDSGSAVAASKQQLRGSGNVAASWRAAAAVSTSSASSVRSCFRSSVGQQPQLVGADATATATVVAVGRPPSSMTASSCVMAPVLEAEAVTDEGGRPTPVLEAKWAAPQPTAMPPPIPPLSTASSARDASVSQSQQQHAASQQAALATDPVSVARSNGVASSGPAASSVVAAAPTLAPMPASSLAVLASPQMAPTEARVGGTMTMTAAPAASAVVPVLLSDKAISLSGRLLRSGDRKAVAETKGGRAAAAKKRPVTTHDMGSDSEGPPPPAYPPGFVSWAQKIFSSVKSKCAS